MAKVPVPTKVTGSLFSIPTKVPVIVAAVDPSKSLFWATAPMIVSIFVATEFPLAVVATSSETPGLVRVTI